MSQNESQPKGKFEWGFFSRASPYLEGMIVVVLLIVANHRISGLVEGRAWFSLLLIGTCYSVWRGGMMPGLVSLGFSALLGAYYYLPPMYSLAVASRADWISLMIYLILGFVIVGFGSAHHAERQRILERDRELSKANERLSDRIQMLDEALKTRTKDLQEFRRWAAEEIT